MNPDCLFCKIVAGTIPAKRVFEDEQALVFADLHPQAPTHLLVVSKEHLSSQAEAESDHAPLLGHLMTVAAQMARTERLKNGFRVVINTGPDCGQTVDHLHLHVLGGRAMHWPPG